MNTWSATTASTVTAPGGGGGGGGGGNAMPNLARPTPPPPCTWTRPLKSVYPKPTGPGSFRKPMRSTPWHARDAAPRCASSPSSMSVRSSASSLNTCASGTPNPDHWSIPVATHPGLPIPPSRSLTIPFRTSPESSAGQPRSCAVRRTSLLPPQICHPVPQRPNPGASDALHRQGVVKNPTIVENPAAPNDHSDSTPIHFPILYPSTTRSSSMRSLPVWRRAGAALTWISPSRWPTPCWQSSKTATADSFSPRTTTKRSFSVPNLSQMTLCRPATALPLIVLLRLGHVLGDVTYLESPETRFAVRLGFDEPDADRVQRDAAGPGRIPKADRNDHFARP